MSHSRPGELSNASLEENVRLFRAAFEAMEPGIVLQDATGRILYCNPSGERLLALRSDDAVGRSSTDPRWHALREDGTPFPGDQHPAMVALRTRRAVSGVLMGLPGAGGVIRWLRIDAVPFVLSPSDERPFVVSTFREVPGPELRTCQTDPAKPALVEERRAVESFAPQAGLDLHCALDRSGCFLETNEEWQRSLGYTQAGLKGRPFAELVHPGDCEGVREILGRLSRSVPVEFSARVRAQDGFYRFVDWRFLPDGDRFSGCGRDRTERRLFEHALRDSEERLRLATDGAGLGTFDYHLDTHSLIWSTVQKEHFGLAPGAIATPRLFLAGVHPEDRRRVVHTILAGLRSGVGGVLQCEYRTIGVEDRRERWLQSYGRVLFDERGRAIRLVGVTREITEQKRAETALAQRNRELQALYRLSELLESEGDLDTALQAIVEEAHGTTGFELIAVESYDPRREVMTFRATHGFETSGPGFEVPLNKTLSGRVVRTGAPVFEYAALEQDDYSNPELRAGGTKTFASFPLAPHGRIWGALSFGSPRAFVVEGALRMWMENLANHITILFERREMEAALRDSESRLQEAQRVARLGHWSFDFERRLLTWSNEMFAIFEVSPEAPESRIEEVVARIHPDDLQQIRQYYDGTAVSREPLDVDFRLRFEDGRVKYVHGRIHTFLDESGKPLRTVGTVHDISERRRMEERLFQSQKAESIGVLAGGVAHDFNNLLTAIMGYASLLQTELPDSAREKMRFIVNSSRKAADLTRQLLTYAGKSQLLIESLDLSSCVREMLDILNASIPKSLTLELVLADDLPPVAGDRGHLQQIIMNLVLNAADAIGDSGSGTIFIYTSKRRLRAVDGLPLDEITAAPVEPGEYVSLAVQDTGTGIDEATRARMFDPFFTTKFTGRGLGLAAVSGAVKAHHGSIVLKTEIGSGSSFEVLIPVRSAGKVDRVEIPSAAPVAARSASVLVADDEPMIRNLLRDVLTQAGYRVELASDGHHAVLLYEENPGAYDLVVLDLSMPVMDGEAAMRAIQAHEPRQKVVLMSGYSESEAMRRFGDTCFSAFVQKPFTVGTFMDRIRMVLRIQD